MKPLWGIDLGGTKIEGVVLDSNENKRILTRLRIPTEQEKGYYHIIHQIEKLIDRMVVETGLMPSKIGIGTPGLLDPETQTIKNSNTTCLIDKPLKADLERALKVRISIANDANCFALAESQVGIVPEMYPNAEVIFGVIMGTGVGAGIVANGKVINGRQGIAGEWGHNFLHDSGGHCYCGKSGCVETILSGKALERYYYALGGNKSLLLPEIYVRARQETDMNAVKTIKRLIKYYGKAIAQVINILDPGVIVLGGGVGNIDLLYTEGVEETKKHVFNNRLDTLFLKPKLGDSAGVFGAAMLD
ncbi:ROK family protein [Rapidithrix thailandica]|uniref:ROK family protein n=1 Tax=Rapidithrix thailandica TaxID=413964 RepID=A0AAW9S2P3_9BACT